MTRSSSSSSSSSSNLLCCDTSVGDPVGRNDDAHPSSSTSACAVVVTNQSVVPMTAASTTTTQVEQRADRVLSLIQQFVTILHSTFCVDKDNHQDKMNMDLNAKTLVERLIPKIQQLMLEEHHPPFRHNETTDNENNLEDDARKELLPPTDAAAHDATPAAAAAPNDCVEQSPRVQMVKHVLWPLLTCLAECYVVLDRVVPPSPNSNNKNKQKPPPPPPGLLSLQHYTDIAVLVEFLVCTSILPLLQSNVLPCASTRASSLPRSLRGRIAKASLLWASAMHTCTSSSNGMVNRNSSTSPVTPTTAATTSTPSLAAADSLVDAIFELRQTVVTIGKVLLLDRFRPMLLPRHVVDLYAAMFQADALEKLWWKKQAQINNAATTAATTTTNVTSTDSHEGRRRRRLLLVPLHYDKVSQRLLSSKNDHERSDSDHQDANIGATMTICVDPITQARAYQTLLSRGTRAPLWLKQGVSKLLTDLACENVVAIVYVFVCAAGQDNMTSASLRLARALAATTPDEQSSNNATTDADAASSEHYYASLCRQLITLLDISDSQALNAPLDASHQAGALTVFAFLDQLPVELVMEHWFPLISQDLVPNTTQDNLLGDDQKTGCDSSNNDTSRSIHRGVRRIGILLSSIPPSSANPWKVSRLLLSPIPDCAPTEGSRGAKVTILGQLLRIAAIDSVVMGGVKEDATYTLQCAVQCLVHSVFPGSTKGSGVEIASLALLYCMAPNELDTQGFRYEIQMGIESVTGKLQAIGQVQQGPARAALDISNLALDLEKMAKIVVHNVLLPLSSDAMETKLAETGKVSATNGAPSLPSTMFHLLLLCYSSSIASGLDAKCDLPQIFNDLRIHVEVAVMFLLPLICENCSPETLLLTDDTGAGILTMIGLILNWTRFTYADTGKSGIAAISQDTTGDEPFCKSSNVLCETLSIGSGNVHDAEDAIDVPMHENWISLSSIVLTLLVTMLELGSQKRSNEEERTLMDMLPTLRTLASFRNRYPRDYKESVLYQPEIAEMAAHAMALIATRSQMPSSQSTTFQNNERPRRESPLVTIAGAEKDLESEQPPIRARGIALLTRICHRYLHNNEEHVRERPLIEVVEESDESDVPDKELLLAEIVRVSIIALGDSESYVFLAAIQSIVAAADVSPRDVIPMIANGIYCESISFPELGGEKETRSIVLLSSEQRIKLVEALLFTIRRRGKAIYEFVPFLMGMFLFGRLENPDDEPLQSGIDADIQGKTHRYFVQGNHALGSDGESIDQSRDQMALRVKTGGPIFQVEESATLRAACINILSELVSMSYPSSISRYCQPLMHFATTSMNLETSRPVRRATAFLCYELYASLLREQEDTFCATDESVGVSLSIAVEMISSNEEEAMHMALRRCANSSEMAGSTTQSRTSSKRRLYDPATSERCKEALHARDEAEQNGAFAAARLCVNLNQQDDSSRTTDLIRARLRDTARTDAADVVKLKLDPNWLALR